MLAGVTVAAFGRQTALLLLLPLALVAVGELRRTPRSWFPYALVLAQALLVLVYVWTGWFVAGWSLPSENVTLIRDLVTWARDEFNVRQLVQLLGRGATAHLVVAAFLAAVLARRSAWRQRSSGHDAVAGWAFLLAAAAIVVQPLTMTPDRTVGSLQRLTVLGLWPLVMGSYLVFRDRFEAFFAGVRSPLLPAALLVVYSQHHLLSWPGRLVLRRAEAFVLVQAVLALGTFVWALRVGRPR